MREKTFEQLLTEGVYDPSIFKAIFLAGGPGSGKSFVAGHATGGQGFRVVNSDEAFEALAKKAGMDLDMSKMSSAEIVAKDLLRAKAQSLAKKRLSIYLDGRLGVVIDGTGRDFDKIKTARKDLEALGYDTYMIFVNTSQDVAVKRNQDRERSLPDADVIDMWKAVQHNMGKFQSLFGSGNFKVIDNSEYVDDKNLFLQAWKDVMKFAKKPIKSDIAKGWIKAALDAKKKTEAEEKLKGKRRRLIESQFRGL